MKGVLVFDSRPDLAFLCGDDEFRAYLYRRAVKDGLLQTTGSTDFADHQFQNAVVQLFAPLVASQQYMQTKNPYTAIKCQSGLMFVFEKQQSLVYLGINGDRTESESFVRRKIHMLHRLVQFFYGPVVEEIKPKQSSEVRRRWKDFSSLLDTWCRLVSEEQCFLVEAVERLHVTPDLSAKTIELLEGAIAMFRACGDKHALHGLMLARSNLVGLYSSRQASELQSPDVLLITLIVQDLFQNGGTLEDLLASPNLGSGRDGGGKVQWPTAEFLASMKLDDADEGDDEDSDSAQYFSVHGSDLEDEDEESTPQAAASNYPAPRLLTERSVSVESSASPTHQQQQDYHSRTVFLHTQLCHYTPHTLHCVQIYPGLALVVVSEITRSKQIGTLCMLFSILSELLAEKPSSGGKYKMERLESIIKKLLDALKKFKGPTQKITADIQKNFDYCKNNGLNQWLESGCAETLSMGLESSIRRLDEVLKKLFIRLSLAVTEMTDGTVAMVKQSFVEKLDDYRAFLAVKAQRNITMTSYIEEYAGLVHFIYVDRKFDHLVAPSINVVSTGPSEPLDATHTIKTKVWDMVRWCQDNLTRGYIAATKLEGDYYYSYYLWFEDVAGNPLIVQTEYTAGSIPGPPGILSSRFYRQLIRHCFPQAAQRSVHCYELMCIHMGIVPPEFTVRHCRKLAASLWESSGDINSTLSLL